MTQAFKELFIKDEGIFAESLEIFEVESKGLMERIMEVA